MPLLTDHIDHLAATCKAICVSAADIVPSEDNPAPLAIPFTRAVLNTSLGDLIRDIDASELGLFKVTPAPDADVRKQPENGARRGEISRVQFPGATPLRRPPKMSKPKEEYEPEVYAQAALRYLDRYQSVRPMPRARSQVIALVEQIDQVRDNIRQWNEALQELTSSGRTAAFTSQTASFAEEEQRISDLQNRIADLRKQKETLVRANETQPGGRSKSTSKATHQPQPPPPPQPEAEPQEDAFWSTPAASARTLRFTDRLIEEEPDFGDVSMMSFDSPGPAPPQSVFSNLVAGESLGGDVDESAPHGDDTAGEGGIGREQQDDSILPESPVLEEVDQAPVEVADDEEKTVVLKEPPSSSPKDPPHSPPSQPPPQPQSTPPNTSVPPEPVSKTPKVRVTPELERIVAKIWNTVGEIIMPGNPFSVGVKPPRAKETLAHIQSLATQSPSPVSPSSSSISSLSPSNAGPTPHQVNTAQLLHALLTAPNHAMPLNKLKAVIGGTRALYACVAKKLIRIDRGGGEQVVLFDV
ncbi:hypothetical protein F5I97DRAFT_1924997 [Phlebopus sp. FC_14]|nr:hypothetical protein F5I97DRAFT_1924997 [Phlebopus sp. FC_14]